MGSRSDGHSANPALPAGPLTIGAVARRSGVSIRALRFYERRGLLPASGRSPGGYRLYTEADLHRLEFIRHANALGLTLDQIRELVVAARERTCAMTRPLLLRVLVERILQTARQIEALSRLKEELVRRRRALTRRPPTDHGRTWPAEEPEIGKALTEYLAGEKIRVCTLAVKFGLRVQDLVDTFHPYLTVVEGLELAALTFRKDVARLSCCAA